ncbi:MAG TPA: FG-GAP-like repeat-containing protein [Thermoanaerobaculia bacterium]|nr:FG-GAP-like repeat-containing protein [Thermoanaerobaculia bacterium]
MTKSLRMLCAMLALSLLAATSADAAMQHKINGDSLSPLTREVKKGEKVRVQGVAVGDAEARDLILERFEVFRPDAAIALYGAKDELLENLAAPATRYFRGHVDGDEDSLVFIGVSDKRLEGFVFRGERRFALGSTPRLAVGARRAGIDLMIQEIEDIDDIPLDGRGFTCELEGINVRSSRPRLSTVINGLNKDVKTEGALSSGTASWTLNLAIETDYELYINSGSSAANVTTFIGNLIGAASTIYQRDLKTDLQVSFLGVQSSSSDPFAVVPGQSGTWNGVTKTLSSFHALLELADRWHNTPPAAAAGKPRSSTLLISGKSQLAGIAWVGTLCSGDFLCQNGNCGNPDANGHYGGAYAFCGGIDPPADLSVPNPNGTVNYVAGSNYWPLIQTTHELGHNVGSDHTHCISLNDADQATYGRTYVDTCYNGQAGSGCYGGANMTPAEKGTIMSYCHLNGGGAQTRYTFGKSGEATYVVPAAMKSQIESYTPSLTGVTAPASIASGATGNASVAAVGGITYEWTITNGVINGSSTSNSVNFSGTAHPVTVRVKATNSSGCSVSDYATVSYVNCTYSLAASAVSLGASALSGNTVGVTAGDNCAWTAVSNSAFISVTGGAQGTGNGTVTYSVQANVGGAPRVGTITIAGKTFTVNQAAQQACSVSLTDGSARFIIRDGATNTIAFTTACSWSASSNAGWLTLNNPSGAGSGELSFTVTPNTSIYRRIATVTIGGTPVTITQIGTSIRGDFDGNGRVDMLWRNPVNGQNQIRLQVGLTPSGTVSLPTEADAYWTIIGAGDFNADGSQDIVWRNTQTGANRVWFMVGTTYSGTGALATVANTAWQLASVFPYDKQGSSDFFWRHSAAGNNTMWFMTGLAMTSTTTMPTVTNVAWSVQGMGDFNNDGWQDIVWRNSLNGQVVIWFLQATTMTSTTTPGVMANASTVLSAIGDFDSDGWQDLLFHNTNDGSLTLWRLGGGIFQSSVTMSPSLANGWRLVGPR